MALSAAFDQGGWLRFPVSVAAGGSVTVTVRRVAGSNAVLSGLFLGDAGPPAGTPPTGTPAPGVQVAPQGDWAGNYGSTGYALGAWSPTGDLASLPPTTTLSLEQGQRWHGGASADVRAVESPDQAERRIGAWYDTNELRLRLGFSAPYSGNLSLYAVYWMSNQRRQDVFVDDGT